MGLLDYPDRIEADWLRRNGLLQDGEDALETAPGWLVRLQIEGLAVPERNARVLGVPMPTKRLHNGNSLVLAPHVMAVTGVMTGRATWCNLRRLWRADLQPDGSISLVCSTPFLTKAIWRPYPGKRLDPVAIVDRLQAHAQAYVAGLPAEEQAYEAAWRADLDQAGALDLLDPATADLTPNQPNVEYDGLDSSAALEATRLVGAAYRTDHRAVATQLDYFAAYRPARYRLISHYLLLLLEARLRNGLELTGNEPDIDVRVAQSRPIFAVLTKAEPDLLRATLAMVFDHETDPRITASNVALCALGALVVFLDEPIDDLASLWPDIAWFAARDLADVTAEAAAEDAARAAARTR